MQKSVMAGLITAAVLVGYALAPHRATAQSTSLPFNAGHRVLLTFEGGRNQQWCTVTQARGDFVGCAPERAAGVVDDREVWYNLRFVERVERRDR